MNLEAEQIVVAGHEAQFDAEEIIEMGSLARRRAAAFLEQIDRHAATAKAAIAAHRGECNDAAFYHEHHVEECGPDIAGATVDEMITKLVPAAVWFSEDEDADGDWCVSIDYSLGEDVTDYMLSARMNADGHVVEVAMES